MTDRPTAAPPIFPFPDHKSLAEVGNLICCQTCGDDVDPTENGFTCSYSACPINREPLW